MISSAVRRGAALLDGRVVSGELLESLRARVTRKGLRPHLKVITVGQDDAHSVYYRQKRLAAEKVGIEISYARLPSQANLEQLRGCIRKCNSDFTISGIIVNLPRPEEEACPERAEELRLFERGTLYTINPEKDVDCFHPVNYGRLALGEQSFLPATPAGILRLLEYYEVETKGKLCVIIGKSSIVGKPLGLMLANENGPAATVVFCDKHTRNLWDLTRQADIVVCAAGKHHLLNDPATLRPDGQAVVVDVGIHSVQTEEGHWIVQGDVDADAVQENCRFITPVPGGVGPMTVACLLEQVVEAASRMPLPDTLFWGSSIGRQQSKTFIQDQKPALTSPARRAARRRGDDLEEEQFKPQSEPVDAKGSAKGGGDAVNGASSPLPRVFYLPQHSPPIRNGITGP